MKRINEGECHWEKKREQPTEEKKKKGQRTHLS